MKYPYPHLKRSHAFTLLELMVAMVILTIAMSIAFQAFSGTIRAWKRGTEVIDGIKHGDFAMAKLVSALDSTIYFYNSRKTYAFTIDRNSNQGLPADTISFVTSSGAFMPADSPFIEGPHRINLFIKEDDNGTPALFATAMPAIADPEEYEDKYDPEPILASLAIQGLEILIWDEENEDWTETWEEENAVPKRIQLTVYAISDDANDEPIEFTRVIEIPVYESMQVKLQGPSVSAGRNRTSGN